MFVGRRVAAGMIEVISLRTTCFTHELWQVSSQISYFMLQSLQKRAISCQKLMKSVNETQLGNWTGNQEAKRKDLRESITEKGGGGVLKTLPEIHIEYI